jgi:hypothetical protein
LTVNSGSGADGAGTDVLDAFMVTHSIFGPTSEFIARQSSADNLKRGTPPTHGFV